MDTHVATNCLNCGEILQGKYCHSCGQKAITHKLSAKHFLAHEVVHGIWHLDKGILFTLRGLLTKPGHFVHNYIAGKRVGHFNLGTLLVLLAGLFLYTTSGDWLNHIHFRYYDHEGDAFLQFARGAARWLLLIIVPVMAKASSDVFQRLQYNYTEHLVMNGFFFSGMLCIMLLFNLLYWLMPDAGHLFAVEAIAMVAYVAIAYRQATTTFYSRKAFSGRILLFLLAVPFYLAGVYFALIAVYYSVVGG
ncbi:MAG TPA: DUF3667 domain-containing protein [Flavipsychrobacter sp.]|nr:DUF3667 domain-containing protein [Flavipsychrobacter sp.]